MKNLFIILLPVLMGLPATCQEKCKDVIYPVNDEKFIFNCCIYAVKNYYEVYYTKNGDSAMVVAKSILMDGNKILLSKKMGDLNFMRDHSIDLNGKYKGYDYEHYQYLYKKAKLQRNIGITMAVSGLAMEITGLVLSSPGAYGFPDFEGVGLGLYIAGIIFFNTGIPLWISGGIKCGNNKKVLEMMRVKTNLTLGTTKDGIGLKLAF